MVELLLLWLLDWNMWNRLKCSDCFVCGFFLMVRLVCFYSGVSVCCWMFMSLVKVCVCVCCRVCLVWVSRVVLLFLFCGVV